MRDGFEDSMLEAMAKATGLQGKGLFKAKISVLEFKDPTPELLLTTVGHWTANSLTFS